LLWTAVIDGGFRFAVSLACSRFDAIRLNQFG